MTVFCVIKELERIESTDHELVGVFKTREGAERFCANPENRKRRFSEFEFEIVEMEMEE